jgi:tetratricopeptide (TPR) repeat protein
MRVLDRYSKRHHVTQSLAVAALFVGLCVTILSLTTPSAFAENSQLLFQRGMQAYNAGRLDEAVGLFKQTIAAEPKNIDAYYNLGALYYKQQRYNDALATFNKLLQISPNDQSARFHVGSVNEKLGKTAEAIAAFEKIPNGSPRYQAAQTHLKALKEKAAAKPSTPASTKPATPSQPTPPQTAGITVDEFATGFSGPTGIDEDAQGFIYVANYSKHCIERVNQEGQHFTIVCNSGIKGPVGLVVDKTYGNIYVANHLDNSVAKVTPDGKVSILTKKLSQPYNLFLDEKRRILYVTQQKSNSVARIRLQ